MWVLNRTPIHESAGPSIKRESRRRGVVARSGSRTAFAPGQRSIWKAYSLAIVITAIALCIRAGLAYWIGDRPLLIVFVIPILVGAYAVGPGPELLATLMIALGTADLLMPPLHGLALTKYVDPTRSTILIAAGVLVGVLNEALIRSRRKVEDQNESLKAEIEAGRQAVEALEGLSQRASQREQMLAITARKQSEDALRRSEEFFRLITNLVPHGIFAKDAAGRHIFANTALAEMAGLPVEEILGKNDFELVADKAQAEAYRADDLAVIHSGKKMVVSEEPRTDLSGRTRLLQTIKIPFTVVETGETAVLGVCTDITERRQAEASLQESEERFRSIFTAAATGIAISTPHGRFLEANAAYCEMLGYTEDELRERNFASLTHPEDLNLNLKLRDEMLAGQRKTFVMEKRYFKKNGDIVWTRHSVAAVRAPGGQIKRFIVVAENITERKLAQEALLRRTTELQVLFDLMPAMLCFKDTKNVFLRVNQRLAETAGRPIAEIEGRPAAEIFPGEADKYYADDLDVIQTGKAKLGIVEQLQGRDGKYLWVQTDKVPVCDKDGKVTGIVVMVQDITERRRIESRLHRLNRLHTVLSEVGEAVMRTRGKQELFDTVCRIVTEIGKLPMVFVAELEANAGVARPAAICGEGPACLREPTSLIPIDGGPLSEDVVGRALRSGVPDFCNDIAGDARMKPWHEGTRAHGLLANAAFPFHLRGATMGALVLYAGETGYFLDDEMRLLGSVSSDISLALEALERDQQRNEAEQKVRQLNAELEKRVIDRTSELEAANKELEAFSYSVSHDLRTPLRAVNGFAKMVLREFGANAPASARENLERIREGAQRMGELIDDLLAFSRLGRESMKCRNFDTAQLVQGVLDESAPRREGRRIEINVGDLPPGHGDPALLKQVWVNLISNAIKYTGGRESAVIDIGCDQKNGENIYFVRDNGAGFDMRYAGRLFGVFQRLHRADEFEGTGVGLAIAHRIIHRHGGRIWAEAEEGRGATFYFTVEGQKT
jgi:PAS domain S-box-containing protein